VVRKLALALKKQVLVLVLVLMLELLLVLARQIWVLLWVKVSPLLSFPPFWWFLF